MRRLVVLLLFCFACEGDPRGTPMRGPPLLDNSPWKPLAPLPTPRQEHGVAVAGGLLFVVGGLAPDGDRVDAYDPVTDAWTAHATLPAMLDHPNVAAAGDRLYLLGSSQSSASYTYDPFAPTETRRWTALAPQAVHRSAAAVGVIGSRIYLAGGQGPGSSTSAELQVYDIASDSWQSSSRGEVAPLPFGRNHVSGAAVDGRFYVIGGRLRGTREGLQNRVDVYDPETNTWSTRAPMPTTRGGAAVGVVRGLIIVTGGEGNPSDNRGVFFQTEAYNPATDRWTTLSRMRTPRHGMGAGGIENRLFVPAGGIYEGGSDPVALLEALTL